MILWVNIFFKRTHFLRSLLKKKGCFSKRDRSHHEPGARPWNLLAADPSKKPNHNCSQTAASAAMHLCFGETIWVPKKLFFPFFFNHKFCSSVFLLNRSAGQPLTKFVILRMNLASAPKFYTAENIFDCQSMKIQS